MKDSVRMPAWPLLCGCVFVPRRTLTELLPQDHLGAMPTEKDGARSWKLLCRVPEESEAKETLPRWELNLEVSLVGKFKDCPCFLTQTARTTRRICSRGSSSSLHAIDEDAVALGEAKDKDGFAIIPGFSERFEETYRALGGTGS